MLTFEKCDDIIEKSLRQTTKSDNKDNLMERYRSGHNEAVLKTVCPKGRVGSNPTLSAILIICKDLFLDLELYCIWRNTQAGRRGAPAKGVGRETGARVRIPLSPPEKSDYPLLWVVAFLSLEFKRNSNTSAGGKGESSLSAAGGRRSEGAELCSGR